MNDGDLVGREDLATLPACGRGRVRRGGFAMRADPVRTPRRKDTFLFCLIGYDPATRSWSQCSARDHRKKRNGICRSRPFWRLRRKMRRL